MSKREDILKNLSMGVKNMDEDLAKISAQQALEENIDALTAINEGLVAGMNEAGRLYEE